MTAKAVEEFVYTVRLAGQTQSAELPRSGSAMSIDADQHGHILFKEEAVAIPHTKVEEGFQRCLEMGRILVTKAAAGFEAFELDSIKLKLALDAGVGVVFVGDAKIEAAIEIEFKRRQTTLTEANAQTNPG